VKEARWLAIFRVHTLKPFSHTMLFGAMRIAWVAAKEVTFKAVSGNLFLVQMHCLGDWNILMDSGPWLFRGSTVVLEVYDGFSNVNAYKLDKIEVWTCIQGVSEGLMKKKELAEKVASKVGVPISMIVNEEKLNPTMYLWARVWLQLNKPLVCVVPITPKERRTFLVQYEKIPTFCFHYGLMGNEITECGHGVHEIINASGDIGSGFLFRLREAREAVEEEVEEGVRLLILKLILKRWIHRMEGDSDV